MWVTVLLPIWLPTKIRGFKTTRKDERKQKSPGSIGEQGLSRVFFGVMWTLENVFLEEEVGFEPTVPFGTPDFESGTFGHSATLPRSFNCTTALHSH